MDRRRERGGDRRIRHTWDTGEQLAAGYPQLEARAPLVAGRRDDLPDGVAAAIDACLAPAPADRPGLDELIEVLTAARPLQG